MPTLPSRTVSISISADPAKVHAFVSDPKMLPRWAPAFAPVVERNGDGWRIVRDGAATDLRVPADSVAGTVDFETRTGEEPWRAVRSRVVPNGDGSEYGFTLFQLPGMPQPVFDGMVAGMGDELEQLKALLEG